MKVTDFNSVEGIYLNPKPNLDCDTFSNTRASGVLGGSSRACLPMAAVSGQDLPQPGSEVGWGGSGAAPGVGHLPEARLGCGPGGGRCSAGPLAGQGWDIDRL